MKTETEKLIELYHRMPVDQLETALQQIKKQQMVMDGDNIQQAIPAYLCVTIQWARHIDFANSIYKYLAYFFHVRIISKHFFYIRSAPHEC